MTASQPLASLPPLTTPQRMLIVFAGGAAGTAIRAGLGIVASWGAGVFRLGASSSQASGVYNALITSAITTFFINVAGAFLLGYLLERLTPRRTVLGASGADSSGRSERRAQALRLGLGTGLMGGFTTYSAFAVDTASIGASDAATATVYAVATLLVGALASAAGIAAASVSRPRWRDIERTDTAVDGDG